MKGRALVVMALAGGLLVESGGPAGAERLRVSVVPTRQGFVIQGSLRRGTAGFGLQVATLHATKDRSSLMASDLAEPTGVFRQSIPEVAGGVEDRLIALEYFHGPWFLTRTRDWGVDTVDGKPIGAIGTVYKGTDPMQYDVVSFGPRQHVHATYQMNRDGSRQTITRRVLELGTGRMWVASELRLGKDVLDLTQAAARENLDNRRKATRGPGE